MPPRASAHTKSRPRRPRPYSVSSYSGSPSDQLVPGRPLEDQAEALLERDGRFPAEKIFGAGDIGTSLRRVVLGQRLEHNPAVGAGRGDHLRGELEERELLRVADVDGFVLTGDREPPD